MCYLCPLFFYLKGSNMRFYSFSACRLNDIADFLTSIPYALVVETALVCSVLLSEQDARRLGLFVNLV